MDPSDLPFSTKLSKCLKHWNTDEFEDEFLSELSENETDLPLQEMCTNGGYPSATGWAEFDGLKIIESNKAGLITGEFTVKFTEESPTGCRDVQWKERHSGHITFTFDLKSGYVEFSHPYKKREYEPDEF